MNPFDYSLCNQTVTIYRKVGEEVSRKVAENCYFSRKTTIPTEHYGKSMEKKFLLMIPGDFPLLPGDRIFAGIGPEEVTWQTFVPALVPELCQVGFAKPCFWDGEITHWEAGNRKETL